MATKPNFLTTVNAFRVKHEPEILMSMGLAGLTFSVVWGIKTTVEAVKICEELKTQKNVDKLTAGEVIKATWKKYLPIVITTGLSIPCIIMGNRVSSKRNAALAAAYTISETALQEYKDKTKEIVGEKKEKAITDAIAQDKVDKATETKEVVMIGDGEHLFLDSISGRYLKTDWNTIERAANELNEKALGSAFGSFTLNEWFSALGLETTVIGDELGWAAPSYNSKGLLKIEMSTAKTKDGKPCGVIIYKTRPYCLN